ncbi:MAG: hypothetical protein ABFD90_04215 [Phycisphaerales bacterium]
MKRRTKIGLLVAAFLGVLVWQCFKGGYGVGVDSVSWLPRDAHNITYTGDFWFKMAEFDIDREAFEKWCAREGMPLHVLGDDRHRTVDRCLPWLARRGVIPPIAEPNESGAWSGIKNFGAGDLFFEERWSNGGGYTLGYDIKEKRGYYWFSHH